MVYLIFNMEYLIFWMVNLRPAEKAHKAGGSSNEQGPTHGSWIVVAVG